MCSRRSGIFVAQESGNKSPWLLCAPPQVIAEARQPLEDDWNNHLHYRECRFDNGTTECYMAAVALPQYLASDAVEEDGSETRLYAMLAKAPKKATLTSGVCVETIESLDSSV